MTGSLIGIDCFLLLERKSPVLQGSTGGQEFLKANMSAQAAYFSFLHLVAY